LTFIQAAFASVNRNLGAAALYIGVVIAAHMAFLAGGIALGYKPPAEGEVVPFHIQAYHLVGQILLAGIVAAAQAVAFSRMGKEIDRPLWRVANDRDALRRFFQLWLTLNLLMVVLEQLATLAGGNGWGPLLQLILLLYMLFFVLLVPVGACIMFSGAVVRKELVRNLAPLGEQLPRTLLLILFGVIQFGFLLWLGGYRHAHRDDTGTFMAVAAIVGVAAAYVDCLVFAGAWHMCIEHRNADQDVDFDF
jgi:hypothetical protein